MEKQMDFKPEQAGRILAEIEGLTLLHDAPMSQRTQFRAGGPADLLVMPRTLESLYAVKERCLAEGWPLTVLGRASNVLVSDRGIRGITLLLSPSLSFLERKGETLIAGAGVPLYRIAAQAARHSLTGFEFASGIPGSAGGAVFMNAGAFDGNMAGVVTRTLYIGEDGRRGELLGDAHDFGYRHSYYSDHPGALIAQVEIRLQEDDPLAIYDRMADVARRRYLSQPLASHSAGSAFRRPPGYFAGKLISDAGMKGYRRGQAGVSAKHAGFIVNHGGASASDILQIFLDVRQAVFDRDQVTLQPEVRLVGDWDVRPFDPED